MRTGGQEPQPADAARDGELERITAEEEKVLKRVSRALEARKSDRPPSTGIDYDADADPEVSLEG